MRDEAVSAKPASSETAFNQAAGDTPERFQIGVVAERLGLSIRTLHHWEEMGLVTPSARSTGGFRLYTEEDIARLTVIRRMKPLGFSLDQMKELLEAFEFLQQAARAAGQRGSPDSDPDTERVAAAEATVDACREQVAARRVELHRLLDWADEFDGLLERRAL